MSNKKSIRFFNDHEVRAVWDEENSKWWFSATDIVRAINDEEDNKKCRNYWKYLKGKMAKEGIQLVSVTNHFKFMSPTVSNARPTLSMPKLYGRWHNTTPITAQTLSLTSERKKNIQPHLLLQKVAKLSLLCLQKVVFFCITLQMRERSGF